MFFEEFSLKREAIFSNDRSHRFLLEQSFFGGGSKGFCLFIMFNPSDADEKKDDPTWSRCWEYTQRWGYLHMKVVNMFSFVTPYPNKLEFVMNSEEDMENILIMREQFKSADLIICAWGSIAPRHLRGWMKDRINLIQSWGKDLYCLGINKDGMPVHPLYQPCNLNPVPWSVI